MRKQIAAVVSLAMLTGLAGCAAPAPAAQTAQEAPAEAVQEEASEEAAAEDAVEETASEEETAAEETTEEAAEESPVYVLMNIPYDDFYKAELNGNDVPVDAVTSATIDKAKNTALVGGTYHEEGDDTVEILGVSFPVLTDAAVLEGLTEAESEEELFGAASYTYVALEEEPAAYKPLTADGDALSFGPAEGLTLTDVDDINIKVETMGKRGDYKLELDGFDSADNETIIGVILHTEDKDYGLRRLENIWRNNELGINVGHTEVIKDVNPTYPAHYETLEGATITAIDYITEENVYRIAADTYLPLITDVKLKVQDAALADAKTGFALTGDLPEAYVPVYTANADGAEVGDGEVTFAEDNKPGTYAVTLTDESGVYETLKGEFVLSTDVIPVEYDADVKALAAVDDGDIENYIANITAVNVGENSYAPKRAKLIGKDGRIDFTNAAFADGEEFEITVVSTGYPDYTFTAEGIDLLTKLEGSYIELFPVAEQEEYRDIWLDEAALYIDDADEAGAMVDAVLGMVTAEPVGEEAAAYYAEHPEEIAFNCNYLGDVSVITVDGREISGTDADGNELFRHVYEAVEGGEEDFLQVYAAVDPAGDGFDYFAFAPDTPGSTYHAEFRYGDNFDDLQKYYEGEYAFWLVGAVQADYDDAVMNDVIRLFVDENLGGEEEEE